MPEIDGMRFLAIMPVVLMHFESNIHKLNPAAQADPDYGQGLFFYFLHSGGHGVLLFFVISGFIIARPFIASFRDKKTAFRYRSYLARRFIRLEPAYFICLLLAFVAQIYVMNIDAMDLLPHLLAAAGYMHSIVYGEWNVLNGVTWSLEVEFQFYVLAPLFASIFLISDPTKRRVITIVAIIAWIGVARLSYDWSQLNLKWSIITYGSYFLTGFLLADLHSAGAFNRKSLWFDILGIASLLLIFSPSRPIYDTVFYLALFIGVFNSRYLIEFLRQPLIFIIGGMCYTVYLYHYPLTYFLGKLGPQVSLTNSYTINVLINGMLYIPVILLACSILFLVIEKPFMNRQWRELRLQLPFLKK